MGSGSDVVRPLPAPATEEIKRPQIVAVTADFGVRVDKPTVEPNALPSGVEARLSQQTSGPDTAPRTGVGDLDRAKVEQSVAGGNMHRYERAEEMTGRVLHILTATRGAIASETANWLWSARAVFRAAGFRYSTWSAWNRAPIDTARNMLADKALKAMEKTPSLEHWCLWLDDDMVPYGNSLLPLVYEMMRYPEVSALSALCSRKQLNDYGVLSDPIDSHQMLPGTDYEVGNLVETEYVGLAFTLHRTKIFKDVEPPLFLLDDQTGGEDVYFSHKLRKAGHHLYTHTGVSVGHLDVATGIVYYASPGAKITKAPEHPLVLVDNNIVGFP